MRSYNLQIKSCIDLKCINFWRSFIHSFIIYFQNMWTYNKNIKLIIKSLKVKNKETEFKF